MKKNILLLLIFLIPSVLFSYDVSFSKKFSKSVSPDLLNTFINITIEDEKEHFINKNIEIFNKYIKNNNTVEKNNGRFTLSPKYKYHKNKQEFTGYAGSLRYSVKSKDAKSLNKFMDDLIELKLKLNSKQIKLNISNVSWVISEKLYSKSLDKLRLDSILWIEKYSKELSGTLNKACTTNKINMNEVLGRNFMASQENVSYLRSKSYSDVTPVNSQKDISINPNFIMECK